MNYALRTKHYALIATFISRIFDPFLMFGVVFFVTLWGHPVFYPAFSGMVVLPFLLYVIVWKMNLISDWDMRDRGERPRIVWTLVAIEIVSVLVFHLWTLFPILLGLIGFAVITHFWKISGHTMSVALAAGSVILRYGWSFWAVLLVVPLVGWSRVIRKNHTIAQVIAGALFAWFLLVIFEYWII